MSAPAPTYSNDRLDAEIVARAVVLPDLARAEGHRLVRAGREWKLCCPMPNHMDTRPSCTIYHKGGKWCWKCFSCGAGGDAVGWFKSVHGMGYPEAVRAAAVEGGVYVPDAAPLVSDEARARIVARNRAKVAEAMRLAAEADERLRAEKAHLALQLWREAVPVTRGAESAIVARYLAGRGIDLFRLAEAAGFATLPVIRFAALPWKPWNKKEAYRGKWPVMVAAAQALDASGDWRTRAVHLTYLDPAGTGKAQIGVDGRGEPLPVKLIWGDAMGSAVRLVPASGRGVGLAEGIETALSPMMADLYAGRPMRPVWAALHEENFSAVRLPPSLDSVELFADPPGPSQNQRDIHARRVAKAVRHLARRPKHAGPPRQVHLREPEAGQGDFNDLLMGVYGPLT